MCVCALQTFNLFSRKQINSLSSGMFLPEKRTKSKSIRVLRVYRQFCHIITTLIRLISRSINLEKIYSRK